MTGPVRDIMTHLDIVLRPDPARVFIKALVPAGYPSSNNTRDGIRAQRLFATSFNHFSTYLVSGMGSYIIATDTLCGGGGMHKMPEHRH